MKKFYLIAAVASFVALWPFFKRGFFESHDGEWMVIRFTAFHQTLRSGQFPVRFVERLNNNYGYPVLNFLYPLPFYLSEIPKILGLGFVTSIKITFIASTVLSVLAMFWALSQVFDKRASLAGAILYLFVPYRFVDLYVRGSIGENVAFAFIPLILASIYKIKKGNKKYFPILSFLTGLLILAHNIIAFLFTPLFLFFSLLQIKEKLKVCLYFALGIFMATFFWLPALYDLKFVHLSQIKVSTISDHLTPLRNLIIPAWGYGPIPNSQGGLSNQLGIVTIFVLLSSLAVISFVKDKVFTFFLTAAALSIFMMTNLSEFLWQNLPGIDVIQFPWRLLSLVIFIASFNVAFLIDRLKNRNLISAVVIVAAVLSTILYTRPSKFVDRGDGFYTTNEDTTTVRDEYLPIWVEKKAPRTTKRVELLGPGQIAKEKDETLNYRVRIVSSQPTTVRVNAIYFPGWQVKIDGKPVPIDHSPPQGLINFQLPTGEHKAIIKYSKSPLHLASELASLTAIVFGAFSLYTLWRKQNS